MKKKDEAVAMAKESDYLSMSVIERAVTLARALSSQSPPTAYGLPYYGGFNRQH